MDIQRINIHKQTFDDITHFIKSDDDKEQIEAWTRFDFKGRNCCYCGIRKH